MTATTSQSDGITTVGVMVAHPDDETLWAGGTLLLHPEWQCRVYTLCRASDPDRAPKYRTVLQRLGASGDMADMDDSPELPPLSGDAVQQTVAALVGDAQYDLFLTHGLHGEYTTHPRHRELSRAVVALWKRGVIHARHLWLFAYDDDETAGVPTATKDAHLRIVLPPDIWEEKRRIVRELYGFSPESWEACVAPRAEAFWCFDAPSELSRWLEQRGIDHEGSSAL